MLHIRATHEAHALRQILEVTRKLAAPFDLDTMLNEVVAASLNILDAERGTIFLYDEETDELVVRVGTGLGSFRIPADKGIVGESARSRKLINGSMNSSSRTSIPSVNSRLQPTTT